MTRSCTRIAAISLAALAVGVLSAAAAVATEPATAGDTQSSDDTPAPPPALDFTAHSIAGEPVNLANYHGKVVLIVNVASRCGFTGQYADLQKLHETYADRGLAILAFPCNQFGGQEPGTSDEIVEFCQVTYGVTFDLFEKIRVNGDDAAPLYAYLTSDETGLEDTGPVKWNFEKFLIDRDGRVVARYRSRVSPGSDEVIAAIERALGPADADVAGPTQPPS